MISHSPNFNRRCYLLFKEFSVELKKPVELNIETLHLCMYFLNLCVWRVNWTTHQNCRLPVPILSLGWGPKCCILMSFWNKWSQGEACQSLRLSYTCGLRAAGTVGAREDAHSSVPGSSASCLPLLRAQPHWTYMRKSSESSAFTKDEAEDRKTGIEESALWTSGPRSQSEFGMILSFSFSQILETKPC